MPLVRPFRTGTQLPATCVTGEMFFNTAAQAGSNSFGCTAANTWTLQGGGGTASPAIAPLQATLSNSTTLLVGSACNTSAPCAVRIGSVTFYYPSPATISLQSGTGTVFIYVDNSGALTAGITDGASPSINCSGCQVVTSISQFPTDSIPLASWSATLGAWSSTGTDAHALLSGAPILVAGPNILLTESGNTITITGEASTANAIGVTGSSGVYDPTNVTEFDRQIVYGENGYSGLGWAYSGGCNASTAVAGVAGETTGLGWGTYSQCAIGYPSYAPLSDFLSGSAPLNHLARGRFALATSGGSASGTQYVGWSTARDGTFANFVGLRYSNTTNVWQCVIRAANADVAAQVMPSIPDGALHTLSIANNSLANSISCTIDSGSTTTLGTIPASTWYFVMGAASAAGAGFTTVEARIHFTGMNR